MPFKQDTVRKATAALEEFQTPTGTTGDLALRRRRPPVRTRCQFQTPAGTRGNLAIQVVSRARGSRCVSNPGGHERQFSLFGTVTPTESAMGFQTPTGTRGNLAYLNGQCTEDQFNVSNPNGLDRPFSHLQASSGRGCQAGLSNPDGHDRPFSQW